MSIVFTFVIVIFVIIVFIGRSAKKSVQSEKKPKNASSARYTNYKPHGDIVSVSREMGDKKGTVLRDDKANDWLARQLQDEHKAFKATSEMFDLKIEHASHCDARLLEQFHRRNCTASGIDLANGSTAVNKSH
ncbi:MAG: hypothetical protein K6G58_00950 [Lachnospiraceae bacterium]|nr:hypothetical protein [Lachnospiraceae bacterium]